MRKPIEVGDSVWLPASIRESRDALYAGLREQSLAMEEEIINEPGTVVSIDENGWAMVDRGSWGQFGKPVSELRRVNDSETTMRFFGRPSEWDAPVTEGRRFQLPPAGEPCVGDCGQTITLEDTGVLIPHLEANGSASLAAWHRLCFLRNVLGPDADQLFTGGA